MQFQQYAAQEAKKEQQLQFEIADKELIDWIRGQGRRPLPGGELLVGGMAAIAMTAEGLFQQMDALWTGEDQDMAITSAILQLYGVDADVQVPSSLQYGLRDVFQMPPEQLARILDERQQQTVLDNLLARGLYGISDALGSEHGWTLFLGLVGAKGTAASLARGGAKRGDRLYDRNDESPLPLEGEEGSAKLPAFELRDPVWEAWEAMQDKERRIGNYDEIAWLSFKRSLDTLSEQMIRYQEARELAHAFGPLGWIIGKEAIWYRRTGNGTSTQARETSRGRESGSAGDERNRAS